MRFIVLLIVFCIPSLIAAADAGPTPPCSPASWSGVPSLGSPPKVGVWQPEALGEGWTPAGCLQWRKRNFSLLLEVAGRFHHETGADGLVERFASVSRFQDVLYWSVTRGVWRTFISEAHALHRPDPGSRREDFTSGELTTGARLFFWQDDNSPIGAAVYRLDVRERAPGRLVVAIENASPVKFLLMPLLDPGEHQFLYILERESPKVWRYYSLMRTAGPANGLVGDFKASYINRAVAIYRHLAGLPTDLEPPAAP